jgi:hypothetical protein
MISVLVPSRQRAELLKDSVKTWLHPDVEVLVVIDDNEPEEVEYEQIPNIQLFKSKQHGYENLHEYYNYLSSKAKGDWLMLGNDDAFMLTEDWPLKIKEDPTFPQVLNVWNERDNLFPIISKAWYEAVGHFSLNTHADSWVQQVAELIDKSKFVPGIEIKHHGEEMNDETHQRVRGVVGQTSESYRRMTEERKEDARRVNEYIKKKGLEK